MFPYANSDKPPVFSSVKKETQKKKWEMGAVVDSVMKTVGSRSLFFTHMMMIVLLTEDYHFFFFLISFSVHWDENKKTEVVSFQQNVCLSISLGSPAPVITSSLSFLIALLCHMLR